MKKIRNKLMLALLLVTLVPTLLIGGYGAYSTFQALQSSSESVYQNKIALIGERIEHYLDGIDSDLFYLRDSGAMELYLSALETNNDHSKRLLRDNLELTFRKFSEQRKIYAQVSYIDGNGLEIVRINRTKGVSLATKNLDLQSRAQDVYFKKARQLKKDKLDISPLNLNHERGKVEKPINPVIRYATPVFKANNALMGIVVLHVSGKQLLKIVAENVSNDEMLTFVNRDGFYYYHPEEGKAWGAKEDLGHGANFFEDYPDISGLLQQAGNSTMLDTGNHFVTLKSVKVGESGPTLGSVVNVASKDVVYAPVKTFVSIFVGIALFALLLTVVLSALLARSISNPVVYLTEAVEKMSKGKLDKPVEVNTKDETHELAQSIERLRKSMKILMRRAG